MTGIDGMRTLADAWGVWDHSERPAEMAGEIEREQNEDADAIAWVREHGGLAEVEKDWNVRSNLKRTCEKLRAKVERQQRHIEFAQGKCRERLVRIAALNKTIAEMRPRLMPEGMEWPMVDGKPVDFVTGYEPSLGVLEAVSIYSNGACEVMGHDGIIKGVKDIHVATPKVLDADGVEIREKRDVWWICEGDERGVHAERLRVETIGPNGLVECSPYNGGTWVYLEPSELYVNKPVPASDGRPLREGEHVYHVETGAELVVKELPKPGEYQAVVVFAPPASHLTSFDPDRLTHERPDSFEQLEKDANDLVYDIGSHLGDYSPSCFNETGDSIQDRVRDLVRRAKALAGDAK